MKTPLLHHGRHLNPLTAKLALLCCAWLGAQGLAGAADYTWDASSSTSGVQDGPGSWGTVGTATAQQHWTADGGATVVAWPNGATDNAIIGNANGAAGIITVGSGQVITLSNLTFNAAGSGLYTLSPGANATSRLSFSPASTVTVAAGVFVTNRCPLSGNGFTKAGDGTFYLQPSSEATNYPGLTIVNAGILIANGGSAGRYALGTGGARVNPGGTLQLGIGGNSADASVQDNASITNAGGVIDWQVNDTFNNFVLESGLVTNSYTGGNRTIIPTGAIILQSGNMVGNPSQNLRIAGGVTANKITSGTVTLGPSFLGLWTNTVVGAGTLALVGTTTLPNSTNIAVAAGAVLDVSGLSSVFTVGALQTLSGSGTVNGNMTMASGAKIQPGTNALRLTVQGNLTLNANVVLVDAGGGVLPTGFYRLLDYSGTKTGSFNSTPTIVNGSAADVAAIDDTSAPGRIYLTVGSCLPATIDTPPANQTGYAFSTATFSLVALGTSPTFQWQVSTDNGGSWNNVTTGSGGNSASYTTPILTGTEAGTQYRCIVSVACNSSSVTSSPATLTSVLTPLAYRSAASGNWSAPATWQQSGDGGATWSPAATSPTAANSTNILVQSGHSVTNSASVAIDDTVVQAGGLIVIEGATVTINDGVAAVDCDVFGTILVDNAAGIALAGTGGLTFENGGKYIWARAAGITVPTATWATGSTCEIQNAVNATPSGLSQSFYHFTWNWPTESVGVSLAGSLRTVNGNLTVMAGQNPGTSVRLLASSQTNNLNVAGDFNLSSGCLALSTAGSASNNMLVNITVGGNFIIGPTGVLDNRATGTNCFATIIFSNSVARFFTNSGAITHTNGLAGINFQVTNNSTINLTGGNLPLGLTAVGQDTFTVDGTLSLGTNKLVGTAGTGALVVHSSGQLTGDGTNQLTVALSAVTYGGTLSLPGHVFAANESFKLFDATTYGGAFTTFSPDPPGAGLAWVTTDLLTTGTLAVSGSVAPSFPSFGSAVLTPAGLVLSGSGGPAGHVYYLVTSTDITAPRDTWTTNATSAFLGDGSFKITNAVNNAEAKRFFRVKYPLP